MSWGYASKSSRLVQLWIFWMMSPLNCSSFLQLAICCSKPLRRANHRRSISPFSTLDDLMGDVDQLLSDLSSKDINAAKSSTNPSWMKVEWDRSKHRQIEPSPVEKHEILNRKVYVKRDDQLKLPGSQISGNKARKMLALNEIPADKFPKCIVSYGGPQSNSMLALAAIANYKNREVSDQQGIHPTSSRSERQDTSDNTDLENGQEAGMEKNCRFVYYTKKLPKFLRKQPSGNLFRAKLLGMELVELSHQEYKDMFENDWGANPKPPIGLDPPVEGNSMWVPQGGAFEMAEAGASVLAEEIISFWLKTGKGNPLSICVPGGTCSTAVMLHHHINRLQAKTDCSLDINVVVIPCVGDAMYARRQMMSLSSQIGESADDIPSILQPSPDDTLATDCSEGEKSSYYSFADPNQDILETFEMLREDHGLVVDLIYGAAAWTILLRHWNTEIGPDLSFDPNNPVAGREIMYVHSGGLEGINSQLLRYKYKGLVEDVQLPGKSK